MRYYEDSTFLTDGASYVGQSTRDDGLSPATTTALVRCGVDLLGFDQLLPGDGRLDAAVWSGRRASRAPARTPLRRAAPVGRALGDAPLLEEAGRAHRACR